MSIIGENLGYSGSDVLIHSRHQSVNCLLVKVHNDGNLTLGCSALDEVDQHLDLRNRGFQTLGKHLSHREVRDRRGRGVHQFLDVMFARTRVLKSERPLAKEMDR